MKFIEKWPDIKVLQAMLLAGFLATKVQDQAHEANRLAVLAMNKRADDLNVSNLNSLFNWYQAPTIKGGKKAEEVQQWKQILADGVQRSALSPPFPEVDQQG